MMEMKLDNDDDNVMMRMIITLTFIMNIIWLYSIMTMDQTSF